MVEFEFVDLPAQSIAVYAQLTGRLGLVTVGLLKHPLDKALLELADGILVSDSLFHHLVDQRFKLVLQNGSPRIKTSLPGLFLLARSLLGLDQPALQRLKSGVELSSEIGRHERGQGA